MKSIVRIRAVRVLSGDHPFLSELDLNFKPSDIPAIYDPEEIASYLVRENGLDGARLVAINGTTSANAEGDMLRLSVWRQVKSILSSWDRVNDAEA